MKRGETLLILKVKVQGQVDELEDMKRTKHESIMIIFRTYYQLQDRHLIFKVKVMTKCIHVRSRVAVQMKKLVTSKVKC